MYDARDFDRDADPGRRPARRRVREPRRPRPLPRTGPHVRGCWVVDWCWAPRRARTEWGVKRHALRATGGEEARTACPTAVFAPPASLGEHAVQFALFQLDGARRAVVLDLLSAIRLFARFSTLKWSGPLTRAKWHNGLRFAFDMAVRDEGFPSSFPSNTNTGRGSTPATGRATGVRSPAGSRCRTAGTPAVAGARRRPARTRRRPGTGRSTRPPAGRGCRRCCARRGRSRSGSTYACFARKSAAAITSSTSPRKPSFTPGLSFPPRSDGNIITMPALR